MGPHQSIHVQPSPCPMQLISFRSPVSVRSCCALVRQEDTSSVWSPLQHPWSAYRRRIACSPIKRDEPPQASSSSPLAHEKIVLSVAVTEDDNPERATRPDPSEERRHLSVDQHRAGSKHRIFFFQDLEDVNKWIGFGLDMVWAQRV